MSRDIEIEAARVLRGLDIHPEPRALVRPARALRKEEAPSAQLDRLVAEPGPETQDAAAGPSFDEERERARREGFAAGVEEGRAKGYEAGHEEGIAAGREDGYEAGRNEGIAAGREAGEEAVRAARRESLERLDSLVRSVASQVEHRIEQSEDEMVALAFDAICRVAGELAVSRAGVRHLLRHAMSQLSERPLLAIRMNEQDLEALRGDEDFAARLERTDGLGGVQWVADVRVELGGCMLDSAAGTLDLTLDTQLRRLRDTLIETRRARLRLEGDAC